MSRPPGHWDCRQRPRSSAMAPRPRQATAACSSRVTTALATTRTPGGSTARCSRLYSSGRFRLAGRAGRIAVGHQLPATVGLLPLDAEVRTLHGDDLLRRRIRVGLRIFGRGIGHATVVAEDLGPWLVIELQG